MCICLMAIAGRSVSGRKMEHYIAAISVLIEPQQRFPPIKVRALPSRRSYSSTAGCAHRFRERCGRSTERVAPVSRSRSTTTDIR